MKSFNKFKQHLNENFAMLGKRAIDSLEGSGFTLNKSTTNKAVPKGSTVHDISDSSGKVKCQLVYNKRQELLFVVRTDTVKGLEYNPNAQPGWPSSTKSILTWIEKL